MKIDRQFLIFRSRDAFNRALANEEINDNSIVFIADERVIWTHGIVFGGESAHAKGFFSSVSKLPQGKDGDWAVVKEIEGWYIYNYELPEGWTRGGEYEFPDMTSSLLDNYIRKEDLFNYIKGYYDNVYVRKDELYTTDGNASGNSGSGSSGKTNYDTWWGSGDGTKHKFVTQDEYDALTLYEPDTIYFITEAPIDLYPRNQFGGKFPLIFSWAFGCEFPVILN